MIFQGKEFSREQVEQHYEETKVVFESMGMNMLSFDDWVQYNNDYYVDKEKALDKWTRKASNKKKKKQ